MRGWSGVLIYSCFFFSFVFLLLFLFSSFLFLLFLVAFSSFPFFVFPPFCLFPFFLVFFLFFWAFWKHRVFYVIAISWATFSGSLFFLFFPLLGWKRSPPELKRGTVVIFHKILIQESTKISICLKHRVFYAIAISWATFPGLEFRVPGRRKTMKSVTFI